MAKKKLQLSELKLKSFVTVMQPAEQKTAKGGYYHHISRLERIISHIGGGFSWTSEKTYVVNEDSPATSFINSPTKTSSLGGGRNLD